MKYVASALQRGETIVYEGKVSWAVYIPYAIVAFFSTAAVLSDEHKFSSLANFAVDCLTVLFWWTLLLIVPWLQRLLTEIAVTDRRIILKAGLISRRFIEMNIDKVESVDIEQSMLGRFLNYGNVIIHGAGGRKEILKKIDAPQGWSENIILK